MNDEVAHQGATDVAEFWVAHDKNGFDVVPQGFVQLGDVGFVVEIGAISESTQQEGGVHGFTKVYGKTFIGFNAHFGVVGEGDFYPFFSFFEIKKGGFFGIYANGDDDFIEH